MFHAKMLSIVNRLMCHVLLMQGLYVDCGYYRSLGFASSLILFRIVASLILDWARFIQPRGVEEIGESFVRLENYEYVAETPSIERCEYSLSRSSHAVPRRLDSRKRTDFGHPDVAIAAQVCAREILTGIVGNVFRLCSREFLQACGWDVLGSHVGADDGVTLCGVLRYHNGTRARRAVGARRKFG